MFTTALLVLQMLTAVASPLPGVYEPCVEAQGCSEGLLCEDGACTPNTFCSQHSDCPAGPDGHPAVCDLAPSDDGDYGFCQVAPTAEGCPDGFHPSKGFDGINICVR